MQTMQKSLAGLFILFLGILNVSAQAPFMVKDINTAQLSAKPSGMTTSGITVFFAATDAVHGRELWKTTGSEVSSVLVKDLNPSGNSNPSNFCNVNGIVFFTATTPETGTELWKTDGTLAGTVLVADLISGAQGSTPDQLTACNGKLFFSAKTRTVTPTGVIEAIKLFVSDGTTAGTKLLANTLVGPRNLTAVGNVLFLSGSSPGSLNGNQLLKTDGGPVTIVKDFQFANETLNDLPSNFINVNGVLHFSAKNNAVSGRQIWKSSGSLATTTQQTNTQFGFKVTEIEQVNGTVFFSGVQATPVQNSTGDKLFRLNSLNNVTEFATAGTSDLTALGAKLFFSQGGQLSAELSSVNTAAGGISTLKTFSAAGKPANLAVAGTTLFFVAGTTAAGRELWKFTAAGAAMVQDFVPGATSSNVSDLCVRNTDVFFACDGSDGNELRRSNGSGIITVRDIGQAGSFPKEFVKMGAFTFFSADNGINGRELWKTDGNVGNATLVADIIVGSTGSNPTNLIVVTTAAGAQTLFFEAQSPANGRELFKLENTANAVPTRISDIVVGGGNAGIGNMTSLNGTLHFTAAQAFGLGDRIWKVNAARTGVEQTGGAMTFANNLIAMGSTLFFTQSPQVGPRTLNKLGSATPVKQFQVSAGFEDPIPQELTVIGSRLFFTAGDGQLSRRLWVTNTAASSATQVSSLAASNLTNFNGRLVFTAPTPGVIGQSSIFKVNTLFNGAVSIATGSAINSLRAAGTNLYFLQNLQQGLVQLSKITEGNNNVVLLREFPIGNSGIASELIAVGGNLYFTMAESGFGHELWKADGVSNATTLVSDIFPGVGNSNVQALRICGSDLFFSANNLSAGQEPWKLANVIFLDSGSSDEREELAIEGSVEVNATPEIKVYPNPASNFVFVDLPQNDLTGTLSILSNAGQLVRSIRSSEGETSIQIEVQDLPKGIYLVRWVQSDEQVVVKKLVVQ